MKKNIIIYALLLVVCLYFVAHFGYLFETNKNSNGGYNFSLIINEFSNNIIKNPIIFKDTIFNKYETTKFCAIFTIVYIFYFLYVGAKENKFTRKGEEHGSAKFAKLSEYAKYKSRKENAIYSKNIKISLTKDEMPNLNTVVFGGSGSGKSFYFATPNLLENNNVSFVVTDPKGSLLKNNYKVLSENGYKIKVFNLVDMEHSDNYNPFFYISKDKDIYTLIENFIENTKRGEKKSGGNDPFWEDSQRALLSSVMFYLYKYNDIKEQTFNNMLYIIQNFNDTNSSYVKKMKELEEKGVEDIALSGYKTVVLAPEKTRASVLVSTAVKFALFNLKDVKNLTHTDTLEIEKIGEEKTAFFIIIPDTESTFNFIISMLYTQIFQKLIYIADNNGYGGLKIHVRFILDEFPNIGKIPDFDRLIATIRSRNMSANVILQNLSQLKDIYKENWETIIGNCASLIFLGSTEETLLKYLSEKIGKETINLRSKGRSKSKQNTFSQNESVTGRSLITPDELGRLNKNQCLIMIMGEKPIIDKKYNTKKHKEYKNTGSFDKNNLYKIENLETKVGLNNFYRICDFNIETTNTDGNIVIQDKNDILCDISNPDIYNG